MKPITFLGDSFKRLREFPKDARANAGHQLRSVQQGKQPADFKPMPIIGRGVEELRVWDETGTYRVIYTARMANAVYVLHAFQKTTQTTSRQDIEVAKTRFAQISKGKP